jgi:cytochrome b involved in lipid metabolism
VRYAGKWYDLSKFVDRHPGGRDWLELTRGQDITEAYEVHHLNVAKVDSVLKPMYVRDADPSYVGRYSWDESGFYKTLKRRVVAAFEKPENDPGLVFCGSAALY